MRHITIVMFIDTWPSRSLYNVFNTSTKRCCLRIFSFLFTMFKNRSD